MGKITKAEEARRAEALDELRAVLDKSQRDERGSMIIYTILRHVSKSGMMRVIDPLVILDGEPFSLAYLYARATGERVDDRGGIRVGGCGMDMGYHLAYGLSRMAYPKGHPCDGAACQSNDHSNGDHDRTPGHTVHADGGYRVRHRWL